MKKNILVLSAICSLGAAALFLNGCKKDDTEAPVVSLSGASEMTISLGTAFSDPGATATDDEDGTLTPSASGTVDYNKKGTYTISYTATDKAGNTGSATRTVHVVNDAEIFAGTYANSTDTCVSTPPSAFSATVATSDSVNNLIKITNFGAFGNTITVYATITSSSLSITTGQNLGGTAAINTVYAAETKVISATAPTAFDVHYKWDDGISNDVCLSHYRR
jgi:hypothetical protein